MNEDNNQHIIRFKNFREINGNAFFKTFLSREERNLRNSAIECVYIIIFHLQAVREKATFSNLNAGKRKLKEMMKLGLSPSRAYNIQVLSFKRYRLLIIIFSGSGRE